MPNITPAQIRGARAMLDWTMTDLAKAASLSISTIKRLDAVGHQPVSSGVYTSVRVALEAAGIRFLFDSGKAEGLWLDHG